MLSKSTLPCKKGIRKLKLKLRELRRLAHFSKVSVQCDGPSKANPVGQQ